MSLSIPQKPPLWVPGVRQGHPLVASHVGLWPMFEGDGTRVMDVMGRFPGTFTNIAATAWRATAAGAAVEFPGQTNPGQYINIGTTPTLLQWTAWIIVVPQQVTAYGSGGGPHAISNDKSGWNNDVLIGITPEGGSISTNGCFAVVHQDIDGVHRTVAQDTTNAVAGQMYVVVATSDGAFLKIYVDGTLRGNTAKTGTTLTWNGAATYIGNTPNALATHLRGWDGDILVAGLAQTCWTPGEVALLAADPWEMFRPRRKEYFWDAASGGAPPASSPVPIIMQMHGLHTGASR